MTRALDALGEMPDIVLYQAGADSHVDDPFGAGYFDDAQWVARDKKIFRACRALDIPVAWNLAGGYNGEKTIALHASTYKSSCEVFDTCETQ